MRENNSLALMKGQNMLDILDDLQADLDSLRELEIEMRIAEENTPEEASIFNALVSMVKSQTEAQEHTLRPLMVRNQILRDTIQATFDRMQAARAVEEIIECCTNVITWRSSVNIYCELLETHIAKASQELLPVIYETLREKERTRLSQTYRKLRGFSNHPNPHRTNWQKLWATVLNQTG